MESRKLRIKGKNIKEIVHLLSSDIQNSKLQPEENIYILISEKFYFRTSSQLMACLILKIEDENNCVIDIVAGGGGAGLLSNSWGAEEKRVKEIVDEIEKICEYRGWEIVCY